MVQIFFPFPPTYRVVLGSFDEQVQEMASLIEQEQLKRAYLKSENERMQKDMSNLMNRLSKLEHQLAEKDKLVERLAAEVCYRRALLAEAAMNMD